jgi:hypothetical protein
VSALIEAGYRGWMVVEPDRTPFASAALPHVIAEEAGSRRWLDDVLTRAHRPLTTGSTTPGPTQPAP